MKIKSKSCIQENRGCCRIRVKTICSDERNSVHFHEESGDSRLRKSGTGSMWGSLVKNIILNIAQKGNYAILNTRVVHKQIVTG
jgi:hypothetical protein